MKVSDAILARRAVKHFDPDHKLTQKEEETLKHLIRQAPTSFNIQNWRFVFVKNPDLRQQIREAAWDQAQITDASLTIVLCADIKAWDKNPQRYWSEAPQEVQDILVPMIKPFYEGREWQQRDEAMRSVGIAAQTIMLAAQEMGYDTCPMIGFDSDKVAELINLPEGHVVGMIVTLGKQSAPAKPKGGYIPDNEVFFEDKF